MSDRQPQPGDRVRVTYEGEYRGTRGALEAVVIGDDRDDEHWYLPGVATFEVLGPADEPDPDPWGTIRTEPPEGLLWVKCSNGDWACLSVCVDDEGDGYVSGFPITGAVPNTPAAEAQTPLLPGEPGPRPTPKLGPTRLAETSVDSLPEWEQELIREDYEKRQQPAPRVFESDGPEPPESVMCLRYLDGDPDTTRTPFLRRTEVGWIWATETSTIVTRHGSDWPDAVRACPGRYVEVVQP